MNLLRLLPALAFGCLVSGASAGPEQSGGWRHEELRRWPAVEAKQGVAVDAEFFYAIDNHAIGKYRKDTGARVAGWEGGKAGAIKHLNAGVVLDGQLYCAHSNFPELPERSSVETWEVATMRLAISHRFDQPPGSLTWVDRYRDGWLVCFAHYQQTSDPARSRVVRFDARWRTLGSWSFPPPLVERFAGYSSSGGAFGPEGKLFVTGHDARELYVLEVPEREGELRWLATVPISAAGQAFAWDPGNAGVLYSIERKTREVIVSRVGAPADRMLEGFQELFDGQTFAGWEQKGNWVIEDGAFYRKDKGGPLTCTARTVPDDFELRFDWKVSKGCNSGVYYRPGQVEYQVLDNVDSPYGQNPRTSAAALYFCMAPARDATRPVGEWNEGRVVCQGSVIQHWLNGEKVIDFDYTDPRWNEEVDLLRIRGGNLGGRGGRFWLQDHGAPVWYRNLRLRVIPPGEKLERSEVRPLPMSDAALKIQRERVEQLLKAKPAK